MWIYLPAPGRYDDGNRSTPLRILAQAIEQADMRKMLVSMFNDIDRKNTRSLEKAIEELPNVDQLTHKPIVRNREVGDKIVKDFEDGRLVPTLSFIDPWGYKGLSLRLINSVLKDWGCESIFFFNYNRINAGLNNTSVQRHIDALFGKQRAQQLRKKLRSKANSPTVREKLILDALREALREMGGEYFLSFRFRNQNGTRTSHYLIFVTKHPLGYGIMKEVMARASSSNSQGVPSYEYNPMPIPQEQLDLDLGSGPLDYLAEAISEQFAGTTLTMIEIYNQHNIGTPFIKTNYKDALLKLEDGRQITADPPASKRPIRQGKRTFADSVRVTISKKKKR